MTLKLILIIVALLGFVILPFAVRKYKRYLAKKAPLQVHRPRSGQVQNDPVQVARSKMAGQIDGHH
jgi:hypothetical protein